MALAKDSVLTFEQGQAWGELQDAMAIRHGRDVLELFDLPIEQLAADVWCSMRARAHSGITAELVMGLGLRRCRTWLLDAPSALLHDRLYEGGTCQQIVSSDPALNLISHHSPLFHNLTEQR
jgi:hypothetical protein